MVASAVPLSLSYVNPLMSFSMTQPRSSTNWREVSESSKAKQRRIRMPNSAGMKRMEVKQWMCNIPIFRIIYISLDIGIYILICAKASFSFEHTVFTSSVQLKVSYFLQQLDYNVGYFIFLYSYSHAPWPPPWGCTRSPPGRWWPWTRRCGEERPSAGQRIPHCGSSEMKRKSCWQATKYVVFTQIDKLPALYSTVFMSV